MGSHLPFMINYPTTRIMLGVSPHLSDHGWVMKLGRIDVRYAGASGIRTDGTPLRTESSTRVQCVSRYLRESGEFPIQRRLQRGVRRKRKTASAPGGDALLVRWETYAQLFADRPLMTLRVSRDSGQTWGSERAVFATDDFPPLMTSQWPPCQCWRCTGPAKRR